MRLRSLVLALAAVLSIESAAHADDVQAAREHFERGSRFYDLGQYLEAAKEYEAAYQAKDDPALLFNCAQAYRGAGDAEKAVRFFKSFLRKLPDAPNRAQVEARIVELQKVAELQRVSNSRPPPQPLPPSTMQLIVHTTHTTRAPNAIELRAARTKRMAGLAAGGSGIVLLGLGGLFTGLASSANGQIVQGDQWSESQQSRRNGFEAGSIAAFAVGGAALVAGTTLYLIGRREERRKLPVEQIQFTPVAGPQGAGVSLSGRF